MSQPAGDPSLFPPLPAYRAAWTPIYMEPIIGSGERVTVAIAAVAEDGSYTVLPVLREDSLRCFPGDGASKLLDLADLCVTSARAHLEHAGTMEGWNPPLEGITAGRATEAHADDMPGILKMAIHDSAFLALLAASAEEHPADH